MIPFSKTFQVSNQSQPDEVTTESSEWKVVGFADRSALPRNILKFCGSVPTYEIKIGAIPLDGQDFGKIAYDITWRNTHYYHISQLGRALWLVNLAGRILLYGSLNFKAVFGAKM